MFLQSEEYYFTVGVRSTAAAKFFFVMLTAPKINILNKYYFLKTGLINNCCCFSGFATNDEGIQVNCVSAQDGIELHYALRIRR